MAKKLNDASLQELFDAGVIVGGSKDSIINNQCTLHLGLTGSVLNARGEISPVTSSSDDEYEFQPGKIALFTTLEQINFGHDILQGRLFIGETNGLSTNGRRGLITVVAHSIHPDTAGNLTLEISNVSPQIQRIRAGGPILSLEVYELDFEEASAAQQRPGMQSFSGRTPNSLFYVTPQTAPGLLLPRNDIILVQETILERIKRSPNDMYALHPRKFEELIADILHAQGCEVILTPQTRDGGKDIIASINTPVGKLLTLVEVKRFQPKRPVRVDMIRQLFGTIHDHGASHGMVVTSSYFTKDAHVFQRRHEYQISLKDYRDIEYWLSKI